MFEILSLKGGLNNVKGFFSGGLNCGLREGSAQGDLAFIRSEVVCSVASVYTSNKFAAAPIKHALRYGRVFESDFILINAKNANAMTGQKGVEDIVEILSSLPLEAKNPLMSSTGVIGYRLPKDKIINGIKRFDFNSKDSNSLATSIMTTDKFKKELSLRVTLGDGTSFNIAAVAKGAGMIDPAMATMLCFITTDADVPKEDILEHLADAVGESFNKVSVDGDTSTNDTVFLMSNGLSGAYDKEAFASALKMITFELAMMILKDGEGSSKVVSFEVNGANSDEEAQRAAVALSNSLLVKTALFGQDPNWGRIASTIGASGIECSEDSLEIYYDDLLIYSKDYPELDSEREEKAYKIMTKDSFKVVCNLNISDGKGIAYGCDLSYEYVKINAEYRT